MPPPRTLLRALPGPAGAPGSFVLPLRKLVLSYCPADAASAGMRAWVAREAEAFARARRSVEVVVQEVPHKQPLAKGFYLNGREKVVPVSNLGAGGVASKVMLLADASGRKIVPLKRRTVVSATESPRGMWSQLHADPTVL